LFGTGEGAVGPSIADGGIVGSVLPAPLAPVTVTIGGVPQKVLYAGAAPGLVAGVIQANIEIAPNTPTGNQPVVMTVGDASSQPGLTVAIANANP
jgi:uncharacterized protein (TIGR03437 family)